MKPKCFTLSPELRESLESHWKTSDGDWRGSVDPGSVEQFLGGVEDAVCQWQGLYSGNRYSIKEIKGTLEEIERSIRALEDKLQHGNTPAISWLNKSLALDGRESLDELRDNLAGLNQTITELKSSDWFLSNYPSLIIIGRLAVLYRECFGDWPRCSNRTKFYSILQRLKTDANFRLSPPTAKMAVQRKSKEPLHDGRPRYNGLIRYDGVGTDLIDL